MMSVWHLLWLLPLAGSFGAVLACCAVAAGRSGRDE